MFTESWWCTLFILIVWWLAIPSHVYLLNLFLIRNWQILDVSIFSSSSFGWFLNLSWENKNWLLTLVWLAYCLSVLRFPHFMWELSYWTWFLGFGHDYISRLHVSLAFSRLKLSGTCWWNDCLTFATWSWMWDTRCMQHVHERYIFLVFRVVLNWNKILLLID